MFTERHGICGTPATRVVCILLFMLRRRGGDNLDKAYMFETGSLQMLQ